MARPQRAPHFPPTSKKQSTRDARTATRTRPKGHVKAYVSPKGKYVCLECNRRRNRAAGHFEGEGTFSIQWRGSRTVPRPVACLTSTDASMIDVFQTHWPGYVVTHTPNNKRARDLHTWLIVRLDDIERFILDIRPWLKSERVRVKAALLLEDVRARAEMRRSPQARAARTARHMKMRELNRRGVREEGAESQDETGGDRGDGDKNRPHAV